jgi:hypothetical protein
MKASYRDIVFLLSIIILLVANTLNYNNLPSNIVNPVLALKQNLQFDENQLSSARAKTFVAIMRSQPAAIQTQLVDLYKPYLKSTDYLLTHPNDNNWNYALELPAENKGVEYFSLAEIQANAQLLKAKGANFVSYDLEDPYTPASELVNPVNSMQMASQILHQNGLKLAAAPSHKLTDTYYASFAPLVDIYILQSQAFQSDSSQYKSYVNSIVPKLRAAHPGMPIIAELSTARGNLQNMMESFSSVANIVDGVTSWYANRPDALAQLNQFLSWFQQNYKR